MAVFTTGSFSARMHHSISGEDVEHELDVPLMAAQQRPRQRQSRLLQRLNRPQYMVGAAVAVLFTMGIILVSKRLGGDKEASQQASDWALRTTVASELRHLARRRAEEENGGGVTTGWGDDDVIMNAASGGPAVPPRRPAPKAALTGAARGRAEERASPASGTEAPSASATAPAQQAAKARLGAKSAAESGHPASSSTATTEGHTDAEHSRASVGAHKAAGAGTARAAAGKTAGAAKDVGPHADAAEKTGDAKPAPLTAKEKAMQRMEQVIHDKHAKAHWGKSAKETDKDSIRNWNKYVDSITPSEKHTLAGAYKHEQKVRDLSEGRKYKEDFGKNYDEYLAKDHPIGHTLHGTGLHPDTYHPQATGSSSGDDFAHWLDQVWARLRTLRRRAPGPPQD